MKDIRIYFSESGVTLPDGDCLGVQNENRAVRLVLTLPPDMVENVSHHVVSFRQADTILNTQPITEEPNSEGAYREGRTIFLPLSRDLTRSLTLSLRVLAVTKLGTVDAIQDSTEPARGLWFHAADGSAPMPDAEEDRQEELFHLLASHSAYEIDTDKELNEFPCTELRVGEQIRLRNKCRQSFDLSPGIVPTLNTIYRACYFAPNPHSIYDLFDGFFLRKPAADTVTWSEVVTFTRSSGKNVRLLFGWNSIIGAYVVQVTPSWVTDSSVYYYVPAACQYVVPYVDAQTSYILQEGWNRVYRTTDESTGDTVAILEPCGAPAAFFDAKCTELEIIRPEGVTDEEDFSVLPFLFSIEIPFEIWKADGYYTRLENGLVDLVKDGFRPCAYHLRADEDAWSYDFQTVSVPGVMPLDVPFPTYQGKELGFDGFRPQFYGIRVVDVSYETVTFQRTSEYALLHNTVFGGSLLRVYDENPRRYYNYRDHVHDFKDLIVSPPTCTTDGCTIQMCESCKRTRLTNKVRRYGHNYVAVGLDGETGETIYSCTRCGRNYPHVPSSLVNDGDPTIIIPEEIPPEPITGPGGSALPETCPHTSYGAPVWDWANDYSGATAIFTCSLGCGHTEELAATVTSYVNQNDGLTYYEASVTFQGTAYTATSEGVDLSGGGGDG